MKENNVEEWKPVVGYEGYEVSSLGRVKSLNYRGVKGREQVMKPSKDKDGYFYVVLCKNEIRKTYFVHRLVAETFIPNPDNLPQVNHKIEGDEGKLINTVDSLEWCDSAYNNNYGTRNERIAKAKTNGKRSKKVYQYTTAHELVGEYPSTREVERQTGWDCGNISACCRGKAKSAYNFIWTYTRL